MGITTNLTFTLKAIIDVIDKIDEICTIEMNVMSEFVEI